MRLLHVKSLEFTEFRDNEIPRYVIASHRWCKDSEATFQDVQSSRDMDKDGYRKVKAFAEYITNHIQSIEWLWIDTCCIDRTNAQELSEAINSMFEWYRNAELCVAYLVDVESAEDTTTFKQSEWFRRGWTLQELLAPWTVVFVTKSWEVIGSKGVLPKDNSMTFTGARLEKVISQVTEIPEHVLYNFKTSASLSVEERLMWMDIGRKTTREEDMSYALYGIFEVAPGANYGEKYDRARQRLLSAIREQDALATEQAARFRTVEDWLCAPDPWTTHNSARDRHEPSTGTWLSQSSAYVRWKLGSTRCLWIHGNAGCGKTILCSEAIEDIRNHCERHSNTGYAIFYFSFSDDTKKRRIDILRSIVAQLGRKGPALTMLQHAHSKYYPRLLERSELEDALILCFEAYKEGFILIDAIDECSEDNDNREDLLEWLETLVQKVPRLRILATSRSGNDIRASMETLGAEPLLVTSQLAFADIRHYVATALSRDRRLSRLSTETKTLIMDTICRDAHGMFRWADCQLQELKRLKSTKPSNVKRVLSSLPATLDATYERMLDGIDDPFRMDALKLLRWVVYAKSTPSLAELAEAAIIDLEADGKVDVDDRGALGDTLEILSDLVNVNTCEEDNDELQNSIYDGPSQQPQFVKDDVGFAENHRQISGSTKITLAHFSVKEYLESERILGGRAKIFHFDSDREHGILANACLIYLMHYSSSEHKLSSTQDFTTFPLLRYAAESWYYHCALSEGTKAVRETQFLFAETTLRDWLRVHQPDREGQGSFSELRDTGSSLYYASFMGLDQTVAELLKMGVDVNYRGGHYENALQAASARGHERIVQMLLDAGAASNVLGCRSGDALQAASSKGP